MSIFVLAIVKVGSLKGILQIKMSRTVDLLLLSTGHKLLTL